MIINWQIIFQGILQLRIYALYRRNTIILVAIFTSFVTEISVSIWIVVQEMNKIFRTFYPLFFCFLSRTSLLKDTLQLLYFPSQVAACVFLWSTSIYPIRWWFHPWFSKVACVAYHCIAYWQSARPSYDLRTRASLHESSIHSFKTRWFTFLRKLISDVWSHPVVTSFTESKGFILPAWPYGYSDLSADTLSSLVIDLTD